MVQDLFEGLRVKQSGRMVITRQVPDSALGFEQGLLRFAGCSIRSTR